MKKVAKKIKRQRRKSRTSKHSLFKSFSFFIYNEIMALYSYVYSAKKITKRSKQEVEYRLLTRTLATVFSLFVFLLSSLLLNSVKSQTEKLQSKQKSETASVLGETFDHSYAITVTPTNSITPTVSIKVIPSPTISSLSISQTKTVQQNPSKKTYTIAIVGDSMVDTMGEVLEYLDAALTKKYPNTEFLLYNYGTGAQNVEMGLGRLASPFNYQSRSYPSLPELKPDVLIVASFAYNPFTPHDRNKHWLTLSSLVQTAKSYTPRVYMLAEIGPLRQDFGKGPQGVNWSEDTNYEHSLRIIEQLENAVGLSTNLGVPLIDAFHPSFNSETREGNRAYVNPADGIHPSVAGHQFMAEKIAQTINLQ